MRIFILFLLFLPLFLSAEPAKVVGVIPVKFNSKGMHAPVPYNQQLMERGWTRVPTYNLPLSNTTGANPRYQPSTVTKKSLARALGYAAGRFASMTPATKALLIGYGAYEANCLTQNYPSMCFDTQFDPEADLSDFTDFHHARTVINATCAEASRPSVGGTKKYGCGESVAEAFGKALPAYVADKNYAPNGCGNNCISATYSVATQSPPYSATFNLTITEKVDIKPDGTFGTRTYTLGGGFVNFGYTTQNTYDVCPPIALVNPDNPADVEKAKYTNGPITVNGAPRCFKNTYTSSVTPEWVEGQIEQNPDSVKNSDIGLDDFVDWETGLPRPDMFENPTIDPVSDAFADAAEAIANGTVQHDNPGAPGYVPADMMPNLLVQINNWHEGNTFTDVFNGKQVDPEAPPTEESKIDWSKFPGITKAQYEASNNAWGNAATSGQPDINSEIDKLTQEQQKLTDFINEPTPALPYEIDFPALFQLPTTGQCRGFTVTGTIRGISSPIVVDKHCPPYESWGRPVIEWFLGIMTIFQCFHIFRRTIEVA